MLVDDGVRTRWRVVTAGGAVDPELLADRPVEERNRRDLVGPWAVPVDDDGAPLPLPPGLPRVVHAPTATDDPVSLPVLFVATLPLDPSRRRASSRGHWPTPSWPVPRPRCRTWCWP